MKYRTALHSLHKAVRQVLIPGKRTRNVFLKCSNHVEEGRLNMV